jgi:hypothetical protein
MRPALNPTISHMVICRIMDFKGLCVQDKEVKNCHRTGSGHMQ